MTHNPANYQQNYQNYYQNIPEQYENYYEDENQDLARDYDEVPPSDLQVPNTRLYAEGYPDVTELYARNAQFAEAQHQVENTNLQYRQEYTPGPNDYYYNIPHVSHHHRTRVPKTQVTQNPSTSSYSYQRHHSLYQTCPLATSHSLQGSTLNQDEKSRYIPKIDGKTLPGTVMNTYQNVEGQSYNMEGYKGNAETYEDYNSNQRNVYQNQDNYEEYYADPRQGYQAAYGGNQGLYANYKGKRLSYHGQRMGKSGGIRKYPVTVKTPKFVTKNQVAAPLNKRPSALCLPVVTQPDPGLVKRKSKIHHHNKKAYDQSEPFLQNPQGPMDNYSYNSAHQMHSEGDMNQKSMVKGLDNLLDQFESKMVINENLDMGDGDEDGGGETRKEIKELSKFLKPRIPASIKAQQEKIAKIKASMNAAENPLQPKMKLSLDKLLNRLQKCENSESGEKLSEKSYHSKKEKKEEKPKERKSSKHRSFNYDTLTRKLSPTIQDDEQPSTIDNKPSTSLTTSLDNKKSSRLLKPLDDHCALDLHRSKSYIVDLIDRALSKELGTVPRGKSLQHDMNPKRAVNTISRHRRPSSHKELCYEVTSALTDSIISNATAPSNQNVDQDIRRCQSDDDEAKNKLCRSSSDDSSYIKQLKQLRWGHIRHIQYEARKLADLEEFLEKCGEIEY